MYPAANPNPVFQPPTLAATDYNIALGPLKGSEKKLSISTLPSFALGELYITTANVGHQLAIVW